MKKLLKYYLMLLIVYASGSVLFSQLYYQKFLVFLFINSIIFVKPKKIGKGRVILVLLLTSICILHYMVFQQNYTSYFGLIMKLISVLFLSTNFDLNDFKSKYVNIMVLFAFISIISFSFAEINFGFITGHFPLIQVWNVYMRPTFFYTFMASKPFRNNSIYWEPGAFQAFLNVALFFILNNNLLKSKKNIFKVIILFIALITTFSTTGYIIFLLLIINFIKQNIKLSKISPKNKFILFTIAILLITSFIYAEKNYKVISNKFNSNSDVYYSTSLRLLDTQMAFNLFSQRPIIGWGFGNSDLSYNTYGIQNVSNNFMLMLEQFGLPIFMLFIILNFINLKYLSKDIFEFIIICICILTIYNTENMMFQPLFVFLIVGFNRKNGELECSYD